MADELTDEQVFGSQLAPTIAQSQKAVPVQKRLSDEEVFGAQSEAAVRQPQGTFPVQKRLTDEDVFGVQAAPQITQLGALGRGAAAGATFNWADEVAGILGAGVYDYLRGDPAAKKRYDEIVARERKLTEEAQKQYPWTTFAGEVAGGLPAMFIPGAAPARGASLARQIGVGARTGALMGAVSGAGAADENRLAGAAAGTITGGVLGGLAPTIPMAAGAAYNRIISPIGAALRGVRAPEDVAASKLAWAIDRDQKLIAEGKARGLTLADWQAAKAAGEPVTLADLGSGNVQALLRSASNISPEARDMLENLAQTRFRSQYERVANDIENIIAKGKDARATREALKEAYDSERVPAYKFAYSRPQAQAIWDADLEQMSQAPIVQNAIRVANIAAKNEAAKLKIAPSPNPFEFDRNTGMLTIDPSKGIYPNLQFWDVVKKSLDKMKTPESQQWSKILREHLDSYVPAYRDARVDVAYQYFRSDNALEAGMQAAKGRMAPYDLQQIVNKMKPAEKTLFQEGYATGLAQDVLGEKRRNVDLTKQLFDSPAAAKRAEIVLGKENMAKIEARLDLERIIDGARKALGNSTTARQLIEMGLAGGVTGGVMGNWDPMAVASGAASGALAKQMFAGEISRGFKKFAGYVDGGVARRVGDLLTSNDEEKIKRAIDMIARDKRLQQGIRDIANRVSIVAAQKIGAGANPPIQKSIGEITAPNPSDPTSAFPGIQFRATGGSVLDNMAEARANGGSVNWTANNSLWQQLSPYQKAAAMALMEADRKDPEAAKNALGAMINRAARSNQDLGSHVSQRIYQPTIEATQQARLPSILKSEQFKDLAGWAERRVQGQEPDPVQGATHFLAPERTMLALEAQDPNKYKSWRSWTGFDPEAQAYRNVVLRDKSHAFLAPEGRYSAPYHGEGGEGYRQPTSQDQAALDRLVADASQRGAMDDLVQKTTQQPSSISEADKANLAKMIQGLQKQPEMAPLPPIQPVQLGSPTPIAPVTPYDQPRAMGGGVLRKFKKKADGGSISSDGVYGDEDFKWPEQPKPQSGWDRDVVLPLARKVEDGQVVKGGGILGSDWHFATPQMALDALNTALHVGTSKISEPYRLDPEAREKMVEMAGSVIGPQAGVGIGRAAALGAEAGLGSHGGRPPMPKGGSSLDPLGYYSQALEAAKAIPQAKGTPEQMLAQLKKAGAKDAEIAATGLDDYLSGKTVVTKDELIKHLNENRVALNEVRSEANARTGDVQRATALEAQERLNAARDELIGLESGRMSNFMNRRRIETLRNDIIPELRREVQAADEASIATRRTQWENYSLDPNNPTYKETVLHLPESVDKLRDLRQSELNRIVDKYGHLSNAPETERAAFEDLSRRAYEQRPDRIDFQSGHFPEPNIIGHMMTSMTKHEGKPVYTIDQIQSDWGQKIRDRVPMSKEEMAKLQARRETLADALAKLPEERKGTRYEEGLSNQIRLLDAEIKTAEGKADGHPLVNTTDQWTNTTLRRALTQAVNEGADYIAIPSGDTVLSYNPGDKAGMRGFYGSSEGEGIVPKNLRKLLSKIDPDSAKSVQIDKLETPTRGLQGEGFTLFPITPKVREIIKEKGLPMFEGTIGAQPVNPYDEDRSVLARFKKDRRP